MSRKGKTLTEVLGNASPAVRLLNPLPLPSDAKQTRNTLSSGSARRGVMNKGEKEFSLFLEAQKRQGSILRWEYEGITLRWNAVAYTPDFVVFHRAYIKLIEVKGAFIGGHFERAIERYRHAKTYWGDVFAFELHQKTKNGWKLKP